MWTLIIWTTVCNWSCTTENLREIPGYKTEDSCQKSLDNWKAERPAQRLINKGVCVFIPDHDGQT